MLLSQTEPKNRIKLKSINQNFLVETALMLYLCLCAIYLAVLTTHNVQFCPYCLNRINRTTQYCTIRYIINKINYTTEAIVCRTVNSTCSYNGQVKPKYKFLFKNILFIAEADTFGE